MRYEPPLDRDALLQTLRQAYGVPAEALTFIPVGYASVCYALDCADGCRYFLKLWPDRPANREVASRRDAVLALTRAFHDRGLLPPVSYPLFARFGALWTSFDGTPLALFPFLVGDAPPDPSAWSQPLWDELARSIAAIHQATSALADVLPPRETFAIPWEAALRDALAAVEWIGPEARPGVRALREFLLPRRADVLAQLERLRLLQERARGLPGPFVLCHTDAHGDNLLVDKEGRFSVLDWDTATVAPPEHDLHPAHMADFDRFLAVYWEAGGARSLHIDHFAFAMLRRYLEDMAARLISILAEEADARADAEALAGMETWGFAQWSTLDAKLERIALALNRGDQRR